MLSSIMNMWSISSQHICIITVQVITQITQINITHCKLAASSPGKKPMLPSRRYFSLSPASRQRLQFYNEFIKWWPSANNFQCCPRAFGPRATLEIIGFGSPLDKASLYTRSPPQARAIKLRIALVLMEWSHAGGGETNIDRGQYWLPSIWHMQYWPQNTIQCYYHTFDSLKTGNFVKFLQLSPSSAVLTHYFLFIFSALQL